jgi:hypothetical protein
LNKNESIGLAFKADWEMLNLASKKQGGGREKFLKGLTKHLDMP